MWLKPILVPFATWLDDRNGNGRLNTIKKWWLDHEVVDEITMEPQVGTNRRDIDPGANIDPTRQKLYQLSGHCHAAAGYVQAPPHPVDRKAALAEAGRMEMPLEALARKATIYRHENAQVRNKERILRWSPAVAAPNSLLRNPTD